MFKHLEERIYGDYPDRQYWIEMKICLCLMAAMALVIVWTSIKLIQVRHLQSNAIHADTK